MLEPDFPENEDQRISTLHKLGILDTLSEERFDRLTRLAQSLFNVPIVLVTLVDNSREWFKSAIGVNEKEIPRSISFCGHAILNDEVFVIPDTHNDQRFFDNPVVTGPLNIRFYAGRPLKSASGMLIGTLCILDHIPRIFSSNDIKLLDDLATLVEREINLPDMKEITKKLVSSENSLIEAVDRLKQDEQREKLRNFCLEMVSRGLPLQQILDAVIAAVEQQNTHLRCFISAIDKKTNKLRTVSGPGLPDYFIQKVNGLDVTIGSGCCGTAACTGTRIIVDDVETHPYWTPLKEVAGKAGVVSCWSQPIINRDGEILGVFSLTSRQNIRPDKNDLQLIKQTAHLIAIALDRDKNDKLIQKQANYDALTGLPNRIMFRDRLTQEINKAKRNDLQVAIMFLDLDNFKNINDDLGHDKGDQLLRQVSTRLSGCLRNIDTVARYGGDEFTIILGQLRGTEHVDRIASQILESMKKPFQLDDQIACLSASIGIVMYPTNSDNIDELIRCADQAMYAAKNSGRSGFQYYSADMQKNSLSRIILLNDLRHALDKNQLQLFYQPIINLKSGQIEKAEALLRWLHPQRGLLVSEDFISISEESGAIIEIGEWVIQQVFQTLCQWRNEMHPSFQIAMNASSVQFRDSDCRLLKCRSDMEQMGIPGEALIVDITEKMLVEGRTDTFRHLQNLEQSGINIALDNFGTGYSSLACLKNCHLDYVKIDCSLINNIEHNREDRALCEAIIAFAHKLGFQVIAEGIETEKQNQILVSADCDFAQGFYFSEPLPAEEFKY